MKIIGLDDFLARHAPGRLLLVLLILLLTGALLLSLLKVIDQKPLLLVYKTALICAVCLATNWVFASVFGAKTKSESVIITALILASIISPAEPTDFNSLALPVFASSWAMASKYVIAPNRRHVFNPAAFGVALADPITGHAATWWVGSYWSLPLILMGALFIVRKIRCLDLIVSFAVAVLCTSFLMSSTALVWMLVREILLRSAFSFFAIVMLTEPHTVPIGRQWRIAFGALVGVFFTPAIHIGTLRFAPETALLIGNVFAAVAKCVRRRKAPLTTNSCLSRRPVAG